MDHAIGRNTKIQRNTKLLDHVVYLRMQPFLQAPGAILFLSTPLCKLLPFRWCSVDRCQGWSWSGSCSFQARQVLFTRYQFVCTTGYWAPGFFHPVVNCFSTTTLECSRHTQKECWPWCPVTNMLSQKYIYYHQGNRHEIRILIP